MDTETGRTNELLDRYKLVENKNKILHLPIKIQTVTQLLFACDIFTRYARPSSMRIFVTFKCYWYINVTFVSSL